MINYEHAMILKNLYVFCTGFLLGIIALAVVFAVSSMRIKTTRHKDQLKLATFLSLKDENNQVHLVYNIHSFTQAFYCMFATAYLFFFPNAFRVLYRNKRKESMFFVCVCGFTTILLVIAIKGIFDITDSTDHIHKIHDWIIIDFDWLNTHIEHKKPTPLDVGSDLQ